jgi:hypothetical protein
VTRSKDRGVQRVMLMVQVIMTMSDYADVGFLYS